MLKIVKSLPKVTRKLVNVNNSMLSEAIDEMVRAHKVEKAPSRSFMGLNLLVRA